MRRKYQKLDTNALNFISKNYKICSNLKLFRKRSLSILVISLEVIFKDNNLKKGEIVIFLPKVFRVVYEKKYIRKNIFRYWSN